MTLSAVLGIFLIFTGRQSNEGELTSPLLFYTGIVLLLLILPYGIWFLKKMKHLSVILLAFLLTSDTLWACPACYGNTTTSDSSLNALKLGIIFLGLLISGVLSSIAFTAYSWSRKSKQMAQ